MNRPGQESAASQVQDLALGSSLEGLTFETSHDLEQLETKGRAQFGDLGGLVEADFLTPPPGLPAGPRENHVLDHPASPIFQVPSFLEQHAFPFGLRLWHQARPHPGRIHKVQDRRTTRPQHARDLGQHFTVALLAKVAKGREQVGDGIEGRSGKGQAPGIGPQKPSGQEPRPRQGPCQLQQLWREVHPDHLRSTLGQGQAVAAEATAQVEHVAMKATLQQKADFAPGRLEIAMRVHLGVVPAEGRHIPGLGSARRFSNHACPRYALGSIGRRIEVDCSPSLGGSAATFERGHMGADYELQDREGKEEREGRELAPWAVASRASRGRRWPEEPDPLRTAFERDRDRIVHSTAFRRLSYKTQVFVNSEGDQYRTRMSHSLEVWQVARSLASALRLNEPLCEALALAHDIGHPPFGHRGEWALNELMKPHGGFRHNAQVLRVVDRLERRSPSHPGLNLTREVRESLLKHETVEDWPEELEPRPARPWLEAQVVDLADSTAYGKHDLEDGLLAHMFDEADVRADSSLWREAEARVSERHPGFLEDTTDRKLRIARIANELIGACIEDILSESKAILDTLRPSSAEDVRASARTLIRHGETAKTKVAELQSFLYAHFYRHEHLRCLEVYAQEVLSGLFRAYLARPQELPPWYRSWTESVGLERAVCDYLAGMTDRFAESEFRRLVDAGGPKSTLDLDRSLSQ